MNLMNPKIALILFITGLTLLASLPAKSEEAQGKAEKNTELEETEVIEPSPQLQFPPTEESTDTETGDIYQDDDLIEE
jgi:hypothetical protein